MPRTVNFVNPIDVKKSCASIDALYGPYATISEVNTSIPLERRHVGRTVGIMRNGGVVEYWYKNGITDADLVEKLEVEVTITDNEIVFISESEYADLVENNRVQENVIYFVYEDE